MAYYHQYVISQHHDCFGRIQQGLRLYYNGTSTYQVIPSSDGANAVLYGANPEKPLVYFEGRGRERGYVHFRGLEEDDRDRIVESLPVDEFLSISRLKSKLIRVGDCTYLWEPQHDKAGRVKYTISLGLGRKRLLLAELQVNSLSYRSDTEPMRLLVLTPDVYELQNSRVFYAIVASIVVMCQQRDKWVEGAGIWC